MRGAMQEVKRQRTADCVVGVFRWASARGAGADRQVGSLLLGLYDRAGLLHHGTRWVRFRPEKAPEQRTREQLHTGAADAALFTADANEEP